uniref:Uncharacterized protein n=1 Tax=Arundo donax TaxID=35708 RepID=A0A0A8YS09_ARUDO
MIQPWSTSIFLGLPPTVAGRQRKIRVLLTFCVQFNGISFIFEIPW